MQIISVFRSKPKNNSTWWAMFLGLTSFLVPPFLGVFAAVIRPIIDKVGVNNETPGIAMGFVGVILALAISLSALVFSIRAYRQGERSWVLWTGLVPSVLIAFFWIVMIVGELLFPH